MALTDVERARIDRQLTAYCATRVPAEARAELRVGYRVEGNSVILYEERPAFRPPYGWLELVVAKFTYVKSRRQWRLYCQHRDRRWHGYQALPTAARLATLLDEVGRDPTGIFWG